MVCGASGVIRSEVVMMVTLIVVPIWRDAVILRWTDHRVGIATVVRIENQTVVV